jgi:hypothetical protein
MTAFTDRLEGPSPAAEIARDMVKRGLPMIPVGLVVGAIWAGTNGALSVGYAMVLILLNFLLSAYLLAWAARISFAIVAAASLGGYFMRLTLVFIAVYAVKDMSWVELVPMCIAIIVTHLGLLVWELRYVSASMAYPGLKPSRNGRSVANSAR